MLSWNKDMLRQENVNLKFADRIAEFCYSKYAELPRTGKPNLKEWTLLAGIVKVEGWVAGSDSSVECLPMEIVSLGTGSKCIGQKKLSVGGDILNDSHAEVMARRGFLRYLYRQAYLHHATNTSDVFHSTSSGKCATKSNITFHLFTSHTPCGDASIFPKATVYSEGNGGRLSVRNSTVYEASGRANNGSQLIERDGKCSNRNVDGKDLKYCGEKSHTVVFTGCKRKVCDTDIQNVSEEKHIKMLSVKTVQPMCVSARGDSTGLKDETSGAGCSTELQKTNKNLFGDHADSLEIVGISKELKDLENARISDIHRTGARCLASEVRQDACLPGKDYHVVGVLRSKPGRGDPTLSLSCSDKLARWNAVGIQGALLSLLLSAPVYLSSVVIGGGCPFSEIALHRAIVGRIEKQVSAVLQPPYAIASPLLLQATLPFSDARLLDDSKNACPSSVVWINVPERPLEVAVAGKKQGVTKKATQSSLGRLLICKKELLKQFINIVCTIMQRGHPLPFSLPCSNLASPYQQWKSLAREYRLAWQKVQCVSFPAWTSKPQSLLLFSAHDDDDDRTVQPDTGSTTSDVTKL